MPFLVGAPFVNGRMAVREPAVVVHDRRPLTPHSGALRSVGGGRWWHPPVLC